MWGAIRAIFAAVACMMLAPAPAHAGQKGWDDASTVARDALVVAAIGLPAVRKDWNGALQAGGSVGAGALVSFGLKEAFPELRPDRSDRKSFPSGHTSVAFAAAASLHNRNGWEIGVPAYLAAVFVGVARVQADKHHWYDVLAGAAIGEASGLLITRARDDKVQFFPWSDGKGGGLALAMRF